MGPRCRNLCRGAACRQVIAEPKATRRSDTQYLHTLALSLLRRRSLTSCLEFGLERQCKRLVRTLELCELWAGNTNTSQNEGFIRCCSGRDKGSLRATYRPQARYDRHERDLTGRYRPPMSRQSSETTRFESRNNSPRPKSRARHAFV